VLHASPKTFLGTASAEMFSRWRHQKAPKFCAGVGGRVGAIRESLQRTLVTPAPKFLAVA
jgi:hypothetical protein